MAGKKSAEVITVQCVDRLSVFF